MKTREDAERLRPDEWYTDAKDTWNALSLVPVLPASERGSVRLRRCDGCIPGRRPCYVAL